MTYYLNGKTNFFIYDVHLKWLHVIRELLFRNSFREAALESCTILDILDLPYKI